MSNSSSAPTPQIEVDRSGQGASRPARPLHGLAAALISLARADLEAEAAGQRAVTPTEKGGRQ